MALITNKRKNWLLYTSGILLIFFLLLLTFIVDTQYLMDNSSRAAMAGKNPFMLLLMAVVFAPVVEEIGFRGYLAKSKIIFWISVLALPIYVLFFNNNIIAHALIFLQMIFLGYLHKNKSTDKNALIIINSVLFAVAHYKIADFTSISLITPMLMQLMMALILSWVIINYRIVMSIIVHAAFNGSVLLIGALYSGAIESEIKTAEHKNAVIEWSESHSFFESASFINNKDSIVGKHITPKRFYNYLELVNPKLKEKDFKVVNPNSPYNIKIYKQHAGDTIQLNKISHELLLEAGILKQR